MPAEQFSKLILLMATLCFKGLHIAACTTAVAPSPSHQQQNTVEDSAMIITRETFRRSTEFSPNLRTCTYHAFQLVTLFRSGPYDLLSSLRRAWGRGNCSHPYLSPDFHVPKLVVHPSASTHHGPFFPHPLLQHQNSRDSYRACLFPRRQLKTSDAGSRKTQCISGPLLHCTTRLAKIAEPE